MGGATRRTCRQANEPELTATHGMNGYLGRYASDAGRYTLVDGVDRGDVELQHVSHPSLDR